MVTVSIYFRRDREWSLFIFVETENNIYFFFGIAFFFFLPLFVCFLHQRHHSLQLNRIQRMETTRENLTLLLELETHPNEREEWIRINRLFSISWTRSTDTRFMVYSHCSLVCARLESHGAVMKEYPWPSNTVQIIPQYINESSGRLFVHFLANKRTIFNRLSVDPGQERSLSLPYFYLKLYLKDIHSPDEDNTKRISASILLPFVRDKEIEDKKRKRVNVF